MSSKPQKPSSFAVSRKGIESVEYIEEQLFGDFNNGMTIAQMLYILDIDNYNKSIDLFLKQYKEYKKILLYPINEKLKLFLSQLDIYISKINLNDNHLYLLKRQKNTYVNFIYNMHPLDFKGYDDIYD